MVLLFSDLLNEQQLASVNYYTYYPVLETASEGKTICKMLPSDDAVSYILEFEIESKKIISGEINWFNEHLFHKIDPANLLPTEKITYDFSKALKKDCIVVNLIDFCYGHSFVKLLNILDVYKQYGHSHDIVVLSFGYINEFIPKNKVNVINLNLSFGETQKVFSFKNILKELRQKYDKVDFAVLDAYKRFESKASVLDFFNFFGTAKDPYLNKKLITFNYRKGVDRSWGASKQAKNVTQLFEVLKKYFSQDVVFCVIGEKDKHAFPDWILDKRIEKFPNPILHEYHYILKNSAFTIGLLGSHMLSASVISPMTFHMLPECYLRVAATDVINYNTFSSQAYFNHVYLEGNSTLSNYTPKRLAYKVLLLFLGKMSLEYKEVCLLLLKKNNKVPLQNEYINNEYHYFNTEAFLEWKKEEDAKHHKIIRIKTILAKIFNR